MLDLLIDQTKLDVENQDGTDSDFEEITDVVIQEWGMMCQERKEVGDERLRRYRLGCEVISLVDFGREERGEFMEMRSGVERLMVLKEEVRG